MSPNQEKILEAYQNEINAMLAEYEVGEDREHLWENYQRITAICYRLTGIHNEIINMEIWGEDWPELKKFRTLVVDATNDRLEKVAAFESRKITGKITEIQLER